MEKIVIDASVALKWQLKDETETKYALSILNDFVEEKIRLTAPTIFAYEIVNAILIAITTNRITEEKGIKAINYNLSLGIELIDFSLLISETYHLANKFKRTAYDSSYLALAEKERCLFYTGDRKLYNSIGNNIPYLKWIGDYK